MDSEDNSCIVDLEENSDLDFIIATLEKDHADYLGENDLQGYLPFHTDSVSIHTKHEIRNSFPDRKCAFDGSVRGLYNFSINLSPTARASWVYSQSLNQVFIDMEKVLMVQFHVKTIIPGMYIRALPVYSSMDYVSIPVIRCTVHAVEDDPSSLAHSREGECQCYDYGLAGHVLRVRSNQCIYCYDTQSDRHSVKVSVPMPQPGTNCIEVPYVFKCKTSCIRGMQRRAINVVFTLESHTGEVMGRQVLPVKICSCPKRDKDRMEKAQQEEKLSSKSKRPMPSQIVKSDPDSKDSDNNDEYLRIKRRKKVEEMCRIIRDCLTKLKELESII